MTLQEDVQSWIEDAKEELSENPEDELLSDGVTLMKKLQSQAEETPAKKGGKPAEATEVLDFHCKCGEKLKIHEKTMSCPKCGAAYKKPGAW